MAALDHTAARDPESGFRVTFETVTDESAEHGDAAARGFICPPFGEWADLDSALARPRVAWNSLRAALDCLRLEPEPWRNLEAVEPSDSDAGAARWLSAIWRLDGPPEDSALDHGGPGVRSITVEIHFPETTTAATRRRILRLARAAL